MNDHLHNRRKDDDRLELILQAIKDSQEYSKQHAEEAAGRVRGELMIAEAEQKAMYDAHKAYCDGKFTDIEKDLNPIKKAYQKLNQPAQWVGWTFIGTAGGALVWTGNHAAAWLAKHFQ